MTRMTVDVQVGTLVAALTKIGGEVTWSGDAPPDSQELVMRGDVDDDEIAANFSCAYCGYDDDSSAADADWRDVRDFIAAVVARDFPVATALAERIFDYSETATAAAEHSLRHALLS